MRTITALACLLFCCAAAEPVPDFKTLYESHDWFRLREALQSAADAPPLYRAAVGAAFHDDAAAERALKTIAGSAAKGSWKANEAVRLLYSVTRRTAPDLDQPVGAPRPSRIRYTMKNHLLHVPLTIDGQAVEYIFDTGAGCSLTMESEGKRLGLKLHDTDAQVLDSITGAPIHIRHTGIAERMKIGDSEFRNIFFLIFPDEAHFLRDRAPGESGVLGLPEIQMLGAVRWDAEGNFEFGFPSAEPPAAEPNVAFDDLRLMVRVEYEKRELLFQLDTGDVESVLYVGFRNEFPDPVKHSGKMAKRTRGGGGGELDYDVIVLPKIELRAGGLDTVPRPADINLKEDLGYGYHGLLGLDLLNQAKVVTLDFRTMSLTLRNGQ